MTKIHPSAQECDAQRQAIRADFPHLGPNALDQEPLSVAEDAPVYLDSAATTLKPQAVVDAVMGFYQRHTANVARGEHRNAEVITMLFEDTRTRLATLLGAMPHEVVFTSGCTDAINLVAISLGLESSDTVVVSSLEHHSNLLPWRMRCETQVVGTTDQGEIDLAALEDLLRSPKAPRLVAFTGLSNVTGTVQPVAEVIACAQKYGIPTLVDAAQMVGHHPIDVRALGCDYLAFSGHKMLGPSGVGILYVRQDRMDTIKPARFGGGMVNKVEADRVQLHDGPAALEAGTPNIEGVLGLGAATAYLQQIGMGRVETLLNALEEYAWTRLSAVPGIAFPFARGPRHAPIFTFTPKNPECDPRYIGRILSDAHGVALNVGYQCAQPLYRMHGVPGAIRASFYLYNTHADVDRLADALSDLTPFLT